MTDEPCATCGHPRRVHDPEDLNCETHADVGLGRCLCNRFMSLDAEVERLRAEVKRLRALNADYRRAPPRGGRMTEPGEADWKMARHLAAVSSWAARDVEAIATIIATAKAEERAAVVAWLRESSEGLVHLSAEGSATLRGAADEIESGEHRREEEE
jgi:hypothetical protein